MKEAYNSGGYEMKIAQIIIIFFVIAVIILMLVLPVMYGGTYNYESY
jgi:hypothetical protein